MPHTRATTRLWCSLACIALVLVAAVAGATTARLAHAAAPAPRFEVQRGAGRGCGLASEPAGRYWATWSRSAGLVLVHAPTDAVVASRTVRAPTAYAGYCPIAVASDARLVAYGDGVFVRVWDPATDAIVFSFEFAHEVRGISFSADARRMTATTYEDSLRVWDVAGWKLVRTIKPPHHVSSVALSPDGKEVAGTGGSGGIWSVDTGAQRVDFSSMGSVLPLLSVLRFSPDGRWLALAGAMVGNGAIVRVEDGAVVHDLGRNAAAVGFSPDGTKVAIGRGRGSAVEVRRTEDFTLVASLKGHDDGIRGVGFRESDGQLRLTAVLGELVGIDVPTADTATWDVDAQALVRPPQTQRPLTPLRIASSGDGRWLATSTSDNEALVWDLQRARLSRRIAVAEVSSASGSAAALAFTPDGDTLVLGTSKAAYVHDVLTGDVTATMIGAADHLVMCEGGSRVATGSGVWNLRDGSPLPGMRHTDDASPDCGRVVTAIEAYKGERYGLHIEVWDVAGKTRWARTPWNDALQRDTIRLSPDGSWLAAAHRDDVKVWDARSGALRHEIRGGIDLAWAPDGRRLAVVRGTEATVGVYDPTSGKAVHRLTPGASVEAGRGTMKVHSLEFSPDGRRLVVAGDGDVAAWDVDSGTRSWTHAAGARAAYVAGGKWIARVDTGGTSLTLLDAATGNPIATLVADAQDWLIYTPDGHFTGSRGADRLAVMVRGLAPSRIAQLALTKDRPDLVLERLGADDSARIAHYRKLHERRLRRHEQRGGKAPRDLDGAARAPRVQIESVELEGREAEIRFTATDPGGALASYDIVVNGVSAALGTGPGRTPRTRKIDGAEFRGNERVVLEPGDNWLELTTFNDAGMESYRDYRQVRVDVKAEPPRDLYVLAFGISDYAGVDLDLDYAHKDAQDLVKLLARAPGYRKVLSQIYVDAQVTRASIRASAELLARASIDDTVIVFVAGHGVHERGAGLGYYYLTHDAKLDDLAATAAPFEEVEALLASTPARRKLLLLDTCESGEHPDDAVSLAEANATSRGIRARTSRALVFKPDGRPRPDRTFLLERDQFIHVDLSARTGAIVMSSSRGGELSYESDALENGMFTEALLEALTSAAADRDGDASVSVSELEAAVAAMVANASGGAQNPVIERANPLSRLRLPRIDFAAANVSTLPLPANAMVADASAPLGGKSVGPPAHARSRGCSIGGEADERSSLWSLAFVALAGLARRRRRPITRCRSSTASRRSFHR